MTVVCSMTPSWSCPPVQSKDTMRCSNQMASNHFLLLLLCGWKSCFSAWFKFWCPSLPCWPEAWIHLRSVPSTAELVPFIWHHCHLSTPFPCCFAAETLMAVTSEFWLPDLQVAAVAFDRQPLSCGPNVTWPLPTWNRDAFMQTHRQTCASS